MSAELPNYKPDQFYKVSVWRYAKNNEGVLVVQGEGKMYHKTNVPIKSKDGWEKLELSFTIPSSYSKSKDKIKVYVWNPGKDTVYFDDLKIQQADPYRDYGYSETAMHIYIDENELNKIKAFRATAFENGLLETTDDSWVKAVMFYGEESYKTEMRLKGDWLDHLQGVKWSFRVKMKKDGAWKGMRTFSIQNPSARHYLDEWLVHKIFEQEDILTPRYGFIPVYLNNKSIGMYAYEEHFEKQLVESKKRREGPILKLTEEAFWAVTKVKLDEGTWNDYPIYATSQVVPYKMSKTVKSESLTGQFNIAKNLLYEYKNLKKSPSEIFDIEKLAKFHALVSVGKLFHGMRWHNQRFYYSPVLSKLEVVGFDCFMETGPMDWVKRPIFGNFSEKEFYNAKEESRLNYYLFTDSVFTKHYTNYLKEYSSEDFWNKIYETHGNKLDFYSSELETEFASYKFDKEYYAKNRAAIRKNMAQFEAKVASGFFQNLQTDRFKDDERTNKFHPKLTDKYIQVYVESKTEITCKLKVVNYNPVDLKLVGYKTRGKVETFSTPKQIGSFTNKDSLLLTINAPVPDKILYKSTGSDVIFEAKILPWSSPTTFVPRQEFEENNEFPSGNQYKVEGKKVIFEAGKKIIDKTVLIPKGFSVIFMPGVEIDIIKGAAFLSYSPVNMKGTADNKIKIYSSDKTANAFTVMQGEGRSVVEHTIFDHLNTFSYKGWGMTGAVNFYETDVDITHTSFTNNHCEDALNIVRSDFNVDKCFFENVFSDAFDSDFCTGKLTNSKFLTIGNDAIDFSGSEVHIETCDIQKCGDKGVSGGEASTLTVKDCIIKDSNIALASKDKSTVEIINCSASGCKYALVALRKKPEFGPAKLIVTRLEVSGISQFHLIEKKSELIIDGRVVKGVHKNVAKRFY